jgi:hypothetical protein
MKSYVTEAILFGCIVFLLLNLEGLTKRVNGLEARMSISEKQIADQTERMGIMKNYMDLNYNDIVRQEKEIGTIDKLILYKHTKGILR